MKCLCWCPDMGHEDPEEDGEWIEAYDVRRCAEQYAEREHSNWSYPHNVDLMVRDPDGQTFAVAIEFEAVPHAMAATPKLVAPEPAAEEEPPHD